MLVLGAVAPAVVLAVTAAATPDVLAGGVQRVEIAWVPGMDGPLDLALDGFSLLRPPVASVPARRTTWRSDGQRSDGASRRGS